MKKKLLLFLSFMTLFNLQAKDIHVSLSGNDENSGEQDSPFQTIHKAVSEVRPGDVIWVRGGTYKIQERIKIAAAQSGREDAPIRLWGYPGEQVVIDGSEIVATDVQSFKMARCIYISHEANYWHFKNLELCNAKDNGMKIEGSHHIVENCKFYDNNDTGLQIGMYKDFTYEETKSLPEGVPEFNPGYQFCRGNKVINCDSYNNYDSKAFSGTDDGGDADGFACKLFPGPGTEFIGCRAWNNSDDNWDLYMVYHPILIQECWAWNAGYDKNGVARGNGNGFKLGGGGSSGGAAFSQSVGAHVVRNCISFNNLEKGFDQNNAYEGMYLFNNIAWGNKYNYRFPTVFEYGGMVMRNNIGWGATASGSVGNHEFLSSDKAGAQTPDTDYNSWTTIDGCDSYKENNKVNGVRVSTGNHSAQFRSLSESLAKAPRETDGSLPDNDFCKLIDNSVFRDKGFNITDFDPIRFMQPSEANGLELIPLDAFTIYYNDLAADMGPFESGLSVHAVLELVSGQLKQKVYVGTPIREIVLKWDLAATGVVIPDLPQGLTASTTESEKTVRISGTPVSSADFIIHTLGGENVARVTVEIEVSQIAPGTLMCISENLNQTVFTGQNIDPVIVEFGGGATGVVVTGLSAGLSSEIVGNILTIAGSPVDDCSFVITTEGGMDPISIAGSISCEIPSKVLTGGMYQFDQDFDDLHADYRNVISLLHGEGATTLWRADYVESNGSAPGGCTPGAIDMSKNGGGIQLDLPSLSELKVNLHFTGTRSITVKWTIEGQPEKVWRSESMSKRTLLNWDVMQNAAIDPSFKPLSIQIVNEATTGGMRMYGLYTRIFTSDIADNLTDVNALSSFPFMVRDGNFLQIKGVEVYQMRLISLTGECLGQVNENRIDVAHVQPGVYLIHAIDSTGKCVSIKTRID